MQDANFNVLGISDEAGTLVERYEYSPYGEGTVYFSVGSNDTKLMTPTLMSRRVTYEVDDGNGGTITLHHPHGLNPIGHQGLMHDEELGLIYNRARMLHPRLGRFVQRDPLGYVDGMSLYHYLGSNPVIHFDPQGLERIIAVLNGQDAFRNGSDPALEGMLINSITESGQPWVTDPDNIVRFFEEDADWSNPRAADWVIEEHEGNCHTIILIGHSNGGDGARKVAGQLNREGLAVQLLFLFDPVGKPWHPGPNGTRNVPNNVETAINIRQTSDMRIGAGHGIRIGPIQIGPLMQGYRVTPGQNITWNPPANQFPNGPAGRGPNGFFAHTEIVYSEDNLQRLREAIDDVPTEGNP